MFYTNCYKYELFILCFTLLLICECSEVPRPRGVSISKASLYPPDKDFTCFDGSQTIRFSEVNDDYCDCFDGSDEPGTSACINGVFHCTNAGHKPENIPSSRVNDGICDCCDGSDEYAHPTANCLNICHQLGVEARLEAQRLAELLKAGSQLRSEAILKGGTIRREMADKVGQLQRDREEAEALRQEKLKLKEEAEALEHVALEQYKQSEEKQDEENSEDEAQQFFDQYDNDHNGILSISEIQTATAFDKNKDGEVSEDEAKFFLGENSEVSSNEFFDKAWPLIKPQLMLESGVFKPPSDNAEPEVDDDFDVGDEADQEEEHDREEVEKDGEVEGEEDAEIGGDDHKEEVDDVEKDDHKDVPEPQYDEETQRLVSVASEARSQYLQVERSVRDIDNEINNLKESLDKDYGQHDEFATLAGKCFDYDEREYIYKLCPFEKAIQQPKSGGIETRLGVWGEWIGEENKYSTMLYKDGTSCWNAPARTAKVNIHCGLETVITSVVEPNRCEYVFEMSTPGACVEGDTNQLHNAHDEL